MRPLARDVVGNVAPHVRAVLRRFREALGASSITVGPVSVSLAPPERPPSRIVTGYVAPGRPAKHEQG